MHNESQVPDADENAAQRGLIGQQAGHGRQVVTAGRLSMGQGQATEPITPAVIEASDYGDAVQGRIQLTVPGA